MENVESVSVPVNASPARERRSSRRPFGQVLRRRGRDGKLGDVWHMRYRDLDGRERWEAIGPGPKGRKNAEEKLAKIRSAIAEERATGRKEIVPTTLRDFWPTFSPILSARHAGTTLRTEEGRYHVAAEFFGARFLHEIGAAEIEDFLARLRRESEARPAPAPPPEGSEGAKKRKRARMKGATGATCNRYLSLLSSVFKAAVERSHARENPTRDVKRAREALKPVPFLSSEDVARLAACAAPEYRDAILLAGDTGLRRGELVALTWRDVDLGRAEIVVRRSKSGKPRTVPLTARALATLRRLLDARGSVPMFDGGPVLPDLAAQPWRLSKGFDKAAEDAGLPVTLHGLRHGFASRLVRAGVDLPTVGRLLGHSRNSLAVTLRYGAHAPESAERDAIRRLEGAAEGVREAAVRASAGA
ncbi:MAG: site-specific integrase [Planctomycetales bacterium]|nr:site-specific integrase [Planctomycetales bacterium]